MSNPVSEVLLGLGGNLGDPLAAMREALGRLDARLDTAVVRVSSLWRTPPWGVIDQPDFLNACALLTTTMSPRATLEQCLRIEQDMARTRDLRWGPRSLDIDILFFGDCVLEEPGLVIPHPRIQERAFVLVPLCEIAPNQMLGHQSIAAWSAQISHDGMVLVKNSEWYAPHPR